MKSRRGPLLVLARVDGQPWKSIFGKRTEAPQGDPRTFRFTGGPEVGAFFGFHRLSDRKITAPTPEAFNAAVRELNRLLPADRPIPTTFYRSSTESGFLREYVRRFGEDGEMPIAPDGTTRIHDLSMHTPMIFAPPELLLHGQAQARAVARFDGWVHREMPDFARSTAGAGLLRRMLVAESQHIDVGTALAGTPTGPIPSEAATRTAFDLLANDGKSPHAHAGDIVSSWGTRHTVGVSTELTDEEFRNLPAFRAAFARFAAEEAKRDATFERGLTFEGVPYQTGRVHALGGPEDELASDAYRRQQRLMCEAYRRRYQEIQEAIQKNRKP